MITVNDRILFLSRGYRKQFLWPYVEENENSSINNIFFLRRKLVICDFPPNAILKIICLFQKHVYIFLWNNLDELIRYIEKDPEFIDIINRKKIYFLFPFEIDKILKKKIRTTSLNFRYQVFCPKLLLKKNNNNKPSLIRKIIFYGEISLPDKRDPFFSEIKNFAHNILSGKKNYNHIEEFVINQLGEFEYYENVLKTRNLVRYYFLKKIANIYKKDLILIGDSLSKIEGATHLSSNYSLEYRLKLYKKYNDAIFLDLLSKSSPSCLYPRSYELLKYSNHIFQLKTNDSNKINNLHNGVNFFNSIEDFTHKINQYLLI